MALFSIISLQVRYYKRRVHILDVLKKQLLNVFQKLNIHKQEISVHMSARDNDIIYLMFLFQLTSYIFSTVFEKMYAMN